MPDNTITEDVNGDEASSPLLFSAAKENIDEAFIICIVYFFIHRT
jgi:hypothetical protein